MDKKEKVIIVTTDIKIRESLLAAQQEIKILN
jgi:hypothetical protein